MTEFDYQWENLDSPDLEFNEERIKEFKRFTKLNPNEVIAKKYCLDAGCGVGRYTWTMQALGAMRVDSIDISTKAIEKCKLINPHARIVDLATEQLYQVYDFILCFGVLHHMQYPRIAFRKLANALKPHGVMHIMVYHKATQQQYEADRLIWRTLPEAERLRLCEYNVEHKGGTIHGWYDALNPRYNHSYEPIEIIRWFKGEGFKDIKSITKINGNPVIHINGYKGGKEHFKREGFP